MRKGWGAHGPTPDQELGKNLGSIDDVKRWLLHPSNWIESQIWIIRWDGVVPKITRRHAERLIRETHDLGLFEVVVKHQRKLKRKVSRGEDVSEIDPQEQV